MNEYKKKHRGFEIVVFPDYKMKSGEVSKHVQSWSSISTFDGKKEISKGWSTRKQAFAGEIKYIEKMMALK